MTKKRYGGNLFYKALKRIFDINIALLMLLPTIFMAFFIKLCYILSGDKEPIIFKQKRIGKNGKYFTIYKFRSMYPNAQEKLNEILKSPEEQSYWITYRKIKNDPRITPVGEIIRHYSIDELPQCLNVLKGEMSIIGPRPLIAGELESNNGDPKFYRKIKPGITGWWACNGRSSIEWSERLKLEYHYIENMGIILDAKCIYQTVKIILSRNGAK